ncbi:ECF-type sigma factor [Phenylobacterium sp.]|uniref:ECF-type sigma factor n=1 Tax=Phenylobacterium sp. TaxID=1871053 RepID=UPI0025FE2EF7|nr:ECF-type sigma factor [Phenylobacterium sp.]
MTFHAVTTEPGVEWGEFRDNAAVRDRLLAAHYAEFRRLARSVLSSDAGKLQIQPTELAHEAAIRLLRIERMDINDRTHFLALASRIMRQILLDEVRRFRACKRQTPSVDTYWGDALDQSRPRVFDIEAFDEALERLSVVDAEMGRIVEHRFYAGLTMEEIADVLGVSRSTVKRQWRAARAWLMAQLQPN